VLLAQGDEIGREAILWPDGSASGGDGTGSTAGSGQDTDAEGGEAGMVGRTVAEVEKDLIINTLHHCLGNRTHAANILGISIRTLRNKLNQYQAEGTAVPSPGEGNRAVG